MNEKIIKLIEKKRSEIVENCVGRILESVPAYKDRPAIEVRKNLEAALDGALTFMKSGNSEELTRVFREIANERLSQEFGVADVLQALMVGRSALLEILLGGLAANEDPRPYRKFVEDVFSKSVADLAGIFQEMRQELGHLRKMVAKEFQFDGNIIGKSKQMREIFALIPRIADSISTVLITGKSGTGKELIAKSIHMHSQRRNKNFVAVNCSALPEPLLESELFGYVKGAFTNATSDKAGLLQEAESGTIFLDEIADMSLALQAKVLRVLQEKEYKKVGGTKTLKADVRVVVATNKDLQREMLRGRFRDDLYYRINVLQIHLPELKERKEDIPLLVEHFIKKANRESGRGITGISRDALKALMDYYWPGNIRELENAIERSVILCEGSEIQREDLCPPILEYQTQMLLQEKEEQETSDTLSAKLEQQEEQQTFDTPPMKLEQIEKESIIHALTESRFRRGETAKKLGINRKTLYRKMKRYGIL